ncbi:hypothetical protein QIS74_12909 [Colletotrichum tabaci]|uniref:Secreted protein n=1 Tax=Colletotrichum tabaci TaxID=1209068 RepID=A0AAV9SW65_9PEZI
MQVFLLILSLVAPTIGAPTEEWTDGISDGFAGPGYIVPNNISIDPFVEIDPTIPGIRLALDLEAADAGLGPDVEPQGGGLEARAAVTTSFILGKTRAEYGCDQSIRAVFESAITTLCYQGGCDVGSSYYRSVRWSKGDRQRVNIRVAVTGTYSGNVRHRLVDAVKQTVNPQSATSYEKRWAVQIGLGGQAVLKCTMSRFPNYVQVTRRVDGNLRDEIKVTVYPPEKEKQIGCIIASTLAAIAGAIGGVAGGFFGTVAVPFCS